MGSLVDRTGHVYGRLAVVRRDTDAGPASNGRRVKWVCQCQCGSICSINAHELASGDAKSCGCLRDEKIAMVRRTHGFTRTPTYRSWQAAKRRCYDPKNARYSSYGAIGVAMCEEWRTSFDAFLADMGERPIGMTLDRIDPTGNYAPRNCRWATGETQAKNKRTNIEWDGKSWTVKSLSAHIGVPRTSLNKLLVRGMTIQAAISHALSHCKGS